MDERQGINARDERSRRIGDSTPTAFSRAGTRFRHARRISTAATLTVLIFSLGTGCASPDETQINSFVKEWEASVSAADYRVQPPDTLEISSAQAPEVDGEIQVVRQDGKITLRLLGEVKVAGLTPVEISRKLESLLARYYLEPRVSVRVGTAGSKKFYVFGQVIREGAFPYTGRDTLLNALAQARPTFIGAKEIIKVIRPSHEEGKRVVMTVNATSMIEKGELAQNVLLQEGDIVYVPPTVIGWMGLRIRELLFPLQPVGQAYMTPAAMVAATNLYGGNDDDDD